MWNSYRLWKTIHALSNLGTDFYVVCIFSEVIFINNLLGYYVKGQLNVFVMINWCVEIKVCYICTHKSGVRWWDGAFDESFSYCDICCGSWDFTRSVSYITCNINYCSVGFSFMWFDTTDYYYICHCPILCDLLFWNEEDCIWCRNSVAHTLRNFA